MQPRTGPRFLITRLSHIGDCLLTLPLAVELRRQYPDCLLVWLCEPPGASLVTLHPAVDDVVVTPSRWFRSWQGVRTLRSRLRQYRFDISFDPQGLLKSSAAAFLSGAPRRLGFRGEHGRELSSLLNNRLIKPQQRHLVDRTLELLHLLPQSATVGPPQLDLPIAPAAAVEVRPFLDSLEHAYCVLNPGASWPSKEWDVQRFGELARELREQQGLIPVVTWGNRKESQMADTIVEVSGQRAVKAPATNLMSLAALCAAARFFVGCDTGPLHLAVASGTSCVGLYGPTRPEDSGAYGSQHVAIQKAVQTGSRRERRGGTNWAMLEIEVADVLQGVERLLTRQAEIHSRGAA